MSHSRVRSRALRAVSAIAVSSATLFTLVAPANAATTFALVGSPNIGTNHNELHAVAVVSKTDAVAVGEYYNGRWDRGLILTYNGVSWKALSAPAPLGSTHNGLSGVAMASSKLGLAVGTYSKLKNSYNLVEKFNGTKWVLSNVPNLTGMTASALNAVADTSATNFVAVGSTHATLKPLRPLTEFYNGTTWHNVRVPDPGVISSTKTFSASLNAVAPVPGATSKAFWAAGTYSDGSTTFPFFDHWNGTSWRQYKLAQSLQSFLGAPSPVSASVSSIDVVAANNVWAVGYYISNHTAPTPANNSTFTAHFNGTSWTVVASPNRTSSTTPNELQGVASRVVLGVASIVAVGRYFTGVHDQTQALQWSTATVPASWVKITSVDKSIDHNELEAVAMIPGKGAFAVGTYYTGTHDRTLIEYCKDC